MLITRAHTHTHTLKVCASDVNSPFDRNRNAKKPVVHLSTGDTECVNICKCGMLVSQSRHSRIATQTHTHTRGQTGSTGREKITLTNYAGETTRARNTCTNSLSRCLSHRTATNIPMHTHTHTPITHIHTRTHTKIPI